MSKRNEPERTAGELLAELESDPAYVEMRRQKEMQFELRRRQLEALEAPLIEELRNAGYDVATVADLRREPIGRYDDAVPVLMRWLPQIDDISIKEDIARALSVPWAKASVPLLLAEFDRATSDHLRWVLGNAVEVFANDALFEQIARRASDRDLGTGRRMLVLALGKMKQARPQAIHLLLNLIEDDQVDVMAMVALGKLKAQEARTRIQAFLDSPNSQVRQQAKTVLSRLDK